MLYNRSNPMENVEAATSNPNFVTDSNTQGNLNFRRVVPSNGYQGNTEGSQVFERAKFIGLALRIIADDANERLFKPTAVISPPRTCPER